MIKSNLISGLLVMNFDEALDFYTKELGFVVVEDVQMGDDRWIMMTLPGNQNGVIVLHEARREDDKALVGKQMGSFPFLGLDTDDCMREYQRSEPPKLQKSRMLMFTPFNCHNRNRELWSVCALSSPLTIRN